MKKLIVALSTIFCTILIIVSIYNLIPSKADDTPQPASEPLYIVADYKGKVAVFESIDDNPLIVYDIYTHLLPENDIELLRKGITISSDAQLQSCLEDLGL